MSESMRELLHADALPLALRQMRDGTATVEQITARAADEIERLQAERDEAREVARELAEARAALLLIAKDAPSICALLMADESFAAALKAASEDIVR